ncbi:hypothetical protein GLIP_0248 [Aliiglaciecola lipolytica E3]|uniref:Uncharacterized protein n=1 Tax=Aliiglaciecola lipolytica E3 TaxID=1127673 RepID=K6Y3Q9_9ALTE|nr:hypothetical protein GLIP_0248 [Aliiglaciecola lipolytica E3]
MTNSKLFLGYRLFCFRMWLMNMHIPHQYIDPACGINVRVGLL